MADYLLKHHAINADKILFTPDNPAARVNSAKEQIHHSTTPSPRLSRTIRSASSRLRFCRAQSGLQFGLILVRQGGLQDPAACPFQLLKYLVGCGMPNQDKQG